MPLISRKQRYPVVPARHILGVCPKNADAVIGCIVREYKWQRRVAVSQCCFSLMFIDEYRIIEPFAESLKFWIFDA